MYAPPLIRYHVFPSRQSELGLPEEIARQRGRGATKNKRCRTGERERPRRGSVAPEKAIRRPGVPPTSRPLPGVVLQKIRYNRSLRASAFPLAVRAIGAELFGGSPLAAASPPDSGRGNLWHRTFRSRSATAPQGQRKSPMGQILSDPIRCPVGQTRCRP